MTLQKDNGELLYERVVQTIREAIVAGALKPGDKLPSVRKYSRESGVSIATVVQGYRLLEEQGFIEPRERSGYIVLPRQAASIAQPEKSRPSLLSKRVSINEVIVLTAEVADNPEYVPLGAATLSPDLSPIQDLKRITTACARNADEWAFFYSFIPGYEPLLKQLAWRSRKWGCQLTEADFVITSGAMEALQLAIRAVGKPGDIIAVESPTFYPILQSLENLGMFALEIPTDPRDGIDLDVFEAMLKRERIAACILVPNFNNPLGYLMPEDKKSRLVQLLSQQGIPIIEDGIYADLHYGPVRPRPLKAYDKEGLVIHCSSISKTLCSGMRVGWIAPGRFMEDVKRVKYFTNVSAPTMSQYVLAETLRSGLYDRHIERLQSLFRFQRHFYLEAIAKYFPLGTRATCPEGGFLFWLELPKAFDSIRFYRAAMEQGISVAPGPLFSATQEYRNCLRLNGGHRWSVSIEKTLAALGKLAHACM